MVKWRNTEGTHNFSEDVARRTDMYSLQGLLIRDNTFSAAIEAYEYDTDQETDNVKNNVLRLPQYLGKAILANALQIPFYILAHKSGAQTITIIKYDFTGQAVHQYYRDITEEQFLNWWQSLKTTIQTKAYRQDFQKRTESSYYDALLEQHGLKWGGNIDGFLVMRVVRLPYAVSAIVENRYTNYKPLKYYDPAAFALSQDFTTWSPLLMLKDQLNVPLFLATYSNRSGEENSVGLAQIVALDHTQGLIYKDNIAPCDNIHNDIREVKRYFYNGIAEFNKERHA